MKVRTLLFCAVAGVGLIAAQAPAAAPIAHWKLDETSGTTVYDSVGTAHGTVVGSLSGVFGVDGNGLEFTPGNYVTMGDVHQMTGTSFTLSAWIRTDNAADPGSMAGRHYTGYFNGYSIGFNNGGGGYGIDGKAMFYHSSNESDSPNSLSDVTDDAWHMVTAVYNLGGNAQLYIDGELEATRSAWTINNSPGPFMLGGYSLYGTLIGALDGALDDVQLYNVALNSNEVAYMFANPGSPVPEPSALALMGLAAGTLLHRRRR